VCIKKWTFSDFCSVAPLWENQGERAHRHSATKEATPYISLSSLSYDHSPLCLTMFFCVACYYHANLLMCHVSCNAVCYVCYVDTVSSWYISLLASVPRITHPSALSTAQHEMCVAVLCLSLKMTSYHGQTCQCRISLTYWSQTDPTDRPIANKNESFFVSAPTWCALMQTHS